MTRILACLLLLASAAPAFCQALMNPAALKEQAPAVYRVDVDTSKGPFVIEVHRDWAPNGADRFYNLVKSGFYDNARFFRVIEGFMVQFGVHGDPKVSAVWRDARIKDDPARISNKRSFVTFATAGPNTRTTQVFISYGDNSNLDSQGFTPFGQVVSGMKVVDAMYSGYGEGAPRGLGPDQSKLQAEGNAYLASKFGNLDYIKKATIEQ
jgi:peptidyl-prolyl cis-trans isomerase A (cyclophilin A)